MLRAYFDDSNTSPDQKVAVVAGYLGSEAQWEKFCDRWGKLLQRYRINSVRRSTLQNLKGEFSSWTPNDRDDFVEQAYDIINDFTYVPIGAAVSTRDFNEITPPRSWKAFGGVYGWCANLCEHDVMEWCDRHNYNDKVTIYLKTAPTGRDK